MHTALNKWGPWALFFVVGWTAGSWWSSPSIGANQLAASTLQEPTPKMLATNVLAATDTARACAPVAPAPRNGQDILGLLQAGYLSEESMNASVRLMEISPEAFEAVSKQFLSARTFDEKERLRWLIQDVNSPLRSQLARQMLNSQDAFDRTSAYQWLSADTTSKPEDKVRLLVDASRKETSSDALAELVDLLPRKTANGQIIADSQMTERLKDLSVHADPRVARTAIGKLATQDANPAAWAQVESALFSKDTPKKYQALDALGQYTPSSWTGPVKSWVEQISKDSTQPTEIRTKAQNMLEHHTVECSS